MKINTLIFCKYCGKKGISCKELKLSGGSIYSNQSIYCKLCKEYNIENDEEAGWGEPAWKVWKENKLTTGNRYKKKLASLLSFKYKNEICLARSRIFSIEQVTEICLSNKLINLKNLEKFDERFKNEDKKNNTINKHNKEARDNSEGIFDNFLYTIFKGINIIPDSIFGIIVYVLIILFCIWIFGDYGGECGVDYAPRFFGEC